MTGAWTDDGTFPEAVHVAIGASAAEALAASWGWGPTTNREMQTRPSTYQKAFILSSPPPSDREYPARPIVGVGAVILVSADGARAMGWSGQTREPGIVLVRRLFEPLAGQWSLPGGTLEVGETLEAGVAREIVEETGLTVQVGADHRRLRSDLSRRRHARSVSLRADRLCLSCRGRDASRRVRRRRSHARRPQSAGAVRADGENAGSDSEEPHD